MIMYKRNGITMILIPDACKNEPYCYLYQVKKELAGHYKSEHNYIRNLHFLKKWIDNNWENVDHHYLDYLNQIVREIEYVSQINRNNNRSFEQKQYAIRITNNICRKILYLLPSLTEQEYNQLVGDNHE